MDSEERATMGAGGDERPLGSYAALTIAYSGAVGAFLLWRRDRALPSRISVSDLALLGVATHKVSRLLAKDRVTAPIRAPFTEYEGEAGPGEVTESPAGSGVRRAIGDLLACPYCLGQWVATAFAAGLVTAPRATRFVAAIFTLVTLSDFLQIAYKKAEEQL